MFIVLLAQFDDLIELQSANGKLIEVLKMENERQDKLLEELRR